MLYGRRLEPHGFSFFTAVKISTTQYTRVIEHKHFEMFGDEVYQNPETVISREYSIEFAEGMEPYYTVNDDKNNAIAEEYRRLASMEKNVIFGGRLAEYKYYDMDEVIEKSFKIIG